MQHAPMAQNTVFHVSHGDEAIASSRRHPRDHPEEQPEERQIAVDPFSLRQFSRLNIDRPLPCQSPPSPSITTTTTTTTCRCCRTSTRLCSPAQARAWLALPRCHPPRMSVAVPPNAPLVLTRRDAHLLEDAPARVASSSVLAPLLEIILIHS
ncbi:hypothetical protein GUJ93_ZPchr0013g36961 [Zizania palustris]|uniref:Uncharacterized protein n=1 Tax=Zizania palustris TaxID=103762 RepID=A0A8J6BZF0_ZIZPA|nr:hypothetical protein GUJ93_ZPchr0013g36961 [Zizania palustris]